MRPSPWRSRKIRRSIRSSFTRRIQLPLKKPRYVGNYITELWVGQDILGAMTCQNVVRRLASPFAFEPRLQLSLRIRRGQYVRTPSPFLLPLSPATIRLYVQLRCRRWGAAPGE